MVDGSDVADTPVVSTPVDVSPETENARTTGTEAADGRSPRWAERVELEQE